MDENLKKKYENVDLESLYEERFGESAPYYNLASEYKSISEWKEIMINAIEKGEPYEVQESYDPDTMY